MTLIVRVGEATNTVASPQWRAFRVTARLSDPVITIADPMHLDGPLSWCAYLTAQEQGVILPPLTRESCVDFRLPLATWTAPAMPGADPRILGVDGLLWGWCCSRAIATEHGTTAVEIRKKPPVLEYARYTTDRRHHDALGPHKARNITLPARLITHLSWWCLGDPDATTALLTKLRGVGRATGHGNGRLLDVTVQAGTLEDRDRWRDRDMPAPDGVGMPGSIRAPYWHETRRCLIVPGVEEAG
jgi:hypothetical protein